MITFQKADGRHATILSRLGRTTYIESHGHFIEDENDLLSYCDKAFSILYTKDALSNSAVQFYLAYFNDLPIGYAKIVINETHESVPSSNSCRLEKIYILQDFIPQKIGGSFLGFIEEKVNELSLDTLWLSVYEKNNRAIRFYEKNEFKNVGNLQFLVNGKEYNNIVFSKKMHA